MAPPRKKKFVDPGLEDPDRPQDIPPEFGGVQTIPPGGVPFQSIPPPPFQTQRGIAQPTPTPDISAVSGLPLQINRINKFFLPKGEVTEQEFRRAKEEAKITTEGGRAAPGVQGLLPDVRADLLNVPRETLTRELQDALAEIDRQAAIDTGALAVSEREATIEGGKFIAQTALLLIPALLMKTLNGKTGSIGLSKLAAVGAGVGVSQRIEKGKITEAKTLTDNSKSAIDDYINEFKAGRLTYTDTIQQLREEINNIRRNQRTVKTLNQALGTWVSGGYQEEADIENYLRHLNEAVLPDLIASAQRQAVGIT